IRIEVAFELYSDIWCPWVDGMIDEAYDSDKRFDNRALARVHTPRLNRVLAVARAATERLGGRWFLDRDPDNLRRDRAFMLSDAGVLVEADLPPEYRLNTGQKRRWEDYMAVHKAALAAVRAVRENPAAPRPELVFPADHPPGSGLARALDYYQIPWRVAAEE
ncbi:MAG: hypothetical protein NZM94_08660, partial [Roseiflexus sp.]|nr:hypothetical protein [Roseiflexus sp.]